MSPEQQQRFTAQPAMLPVGDVSPMRHAVRPPSGAGMSALTLFAMALGGMGLGFGAFVYLVPFQKNARELKRRTGEVMAQRASAAAHMQEIEQLKTDLSQTLGVSNLAESQWRSDFKLIAATITDRVRGLDVKVNLDARRLRISFTDDALFDAKGGSFTKAGQTALEGVAQAVGDKAGRILITAPMGSARVPRWAAEQYSSPADLGASRVRSVARIFTRFGAAPGAVWGVTTGGPTGGEAANPTLDLEIEPRF